VSALRRAVSAGLVLIVASAGAWADDRISREAQSLIQRGDMAYSRVEDLRARARALSARIEAADTDADAAPAGETGNGSVTGKGAGTGLATRSAPGREPAQQTSGDRAAMEAELARTMVKLRWFEEHALDLWERAVAIDADAQDAILQRLRGSGLKS